MRSQTTCKKCGSVYKLTVTKFPVRDTVSIDCTACGPVQQIEAQNS